MPTSTMPACDMCGQIMMYDGVLVEINHTGYDRVCTTCHASRIVECACCERHIDTLTDRHHDAIDDDGDQCVICHYCAVRDRRCDYVRCDCPDCAHTDAYIAPGYQTHLGDCGRVVCDDCWDVSGLVCDWCNSRFLRSDDGMIDDACATLCSACANDALQCVCCDAYIDSDRESSHSVNDDTLCNECFYQSYTYCHGCQQPAAHDAICPDCEYCIECCDCPRSRTHIPDDVPYGVLTIGIEIEVNDLSYAQRREVESHYWEIVSDSSCGLEIKSPVLHERNFSQELRALLSDIKADGRPPIDRRCGVHVHIGAQDMSWQDLRKVMALWAQLEEWIYDRLAPSRRNGIMCPPTDWLASRILACDSQHEMDDIIYGGRVPRKHEKYDDARYFGINCHSYYYRGTIEFRAHQASLNARKISYWVDFLCRLCHYAIDHNDADILRINSGYTLLALTDAPQDAVEYWIDRAETFSARS